MSATLIKEQGSIAAADAKKDIDFVSTLWDQTLNECKDKIGEHDFKNIKEFERVSDLLSALRQKYGNHSNKLIITTLNQITPCLERIQSFTTIMAVVLRGSVIRIALLWGVISLVVEACKLNKDRLRKINETLDDIAHDLIIFQDYDWLFKTNPDLEDTIVTAFIEMVKFLAYSIQYLTKNPAVNFALVVVDYQSEFESTRRRIVKQTNRIKERAQARALQRGQPEVLQELNEKFRASQNSERASLPCNNLRLQPDPNFCSRKSVLEMLHDKLNHSPSKPAFQSFALCGIPGIGKTSVALVYAHERISAGVRIVLWINSETAVEMDRSFTGIAVNNLKIPGAAENGNPRQNRNLVVTRLQDAQEPWLLVFDNAEDPNELRDCWPSSVFGSILVTSRSEIVAYHTKSPSLLMRPFTKEEGIEFLTKILRRKHYSEDEQKAAGEYSEEVDGLPLILQLVGTKMLTFGISIRKSVDQYRRNPSRIHKKGKSDNLNMYYPKGLDMVWEEIFPPLEEEEVSDNVLAVMGVLSFMAADDIPEIIFRPDNLEALSQSLRFCEDEEDLDNAVAPLHRKSLIQRDPETNTVSMHRVVQDGFRYWIGPEKSFENFRAAAKLLFEAFPRHAKGMSLRNQWAACQMLVSHVLSMCKRYRQERYNSVFPGDLVTFSELLKSCGWFLMERGSWSEFGDLFATADLVCDDKESLTWAHLCNTAGCVEYERGNARKSRPWMEISLEIRKRLLPANDLELSDAYNNFANLLMTESQSKEVLNSALSLYQQAIDIDENTPGGEKVLHIRYINIGAACTWQGKFDVAYDYYERARKCAISTFGPECHFVGRADYLEARNLYCQGKWEEARVLFKRAHKIFAKENAFHPGVAATLLKLASIDVKLGQVGQAIETLEEAKLICKLNEKAKGDQGATARISRMLAYALEMEGKTKEAEEHKKSAEAIRQAVQGLRYNELPDCEGSYNMMVFHGDR